MFLVEKKSTNANGQDFSVRDQLIINVNQNHHRQLHNIIYKDFKKLLSTIKIREITKYK